MVWTLEVSNVCLLEEERSWREVTYIGKRDLGCDLSQLLARKITKGIHSCKPASLNRPILNGWLDGWLYTEWLTGRLYFVAEKPRMDGNTTSSVTPFSDCLGFKPSTCAGLHSRGRLLCGVRKHIQRHLPRNQASGGGYCQLQTGGSGWVRWKTQKQSEQWKGLTFSKRVFN